MHFANAEKLLGMPLLSIIIIINKSVKCSFQ